MNSDEEYLDRLLRSMEHKEAEIDTEILPDTADAPQEISFGTYTRRNPSDHYPVMVRIKWK